MLTNTQPHQPELPSTRNSNGCSKTKHIIKSFVQACRCCYPNIKIKPADQCCDDPNRCSPESMFGQTLGCALGSGLGMCLLPMDPVCKFATAMALGIGQAPLTGACIHGCQGVAQRGPMIPEPPNRRHSAPLNTFGYSPTAPAAIARSPHFDTKNNIRIFQEHQQKLNRVRQSTRKLPMPPPSARNSMPH